MLELSKISYHRNAALPQLLLPYLDFAGAAEGQMPDVASRHRIEAAFKAGDVEAYFREIRRFLSYGLNEIIFGKYLGIRGRDLALLGCGTFYSRIQDALSAAKNTVCRFCCQCSQGEGCCVLPPQGDSSTGWFALKSLDGPGSLLRLIDESLPVKAGWSIALIKDDALRKQFQNSRDHVSNYFAGQGRSFASKRLSELVLNQEPQSVADYLGKILVSAGVTDRELEPLWQEAVGCLLGTRSGALPLFGYGDGLPEGVRSALAPNRAWLESSRLTVAELLNMAGALWSLQGSALHYFHFGLGYEEDVRIGTESRFAVHGDLVLVESGASSLCADELTGIHLLMQEAMSSTAILEHGLVQGFLEGELQRAETTRRLLRKMHHSIGGPISIAFNRFAVRKDKMAEQCNDERDRQALAEIYATLRSVKGQTVAWTAFSNPERLGDRKIKCRVDLAETLRTIMLNLAEEEGRAWGKIPQESDWQVEAVMDEGLIEVALWQMARNAYDHLRNSRPENLGKAPLIFAVERGTAHWSLRVENGGDPCPPEQVVALHMAIQSRCDAPSSKPDGQGLGLLTCTEIADFHGGHFAIESNAGRFVAKLVIPTGG